MVSHLLLLPWCTAFTGYQINNNNSNNQQQSTTCYRHPKQANCYQMRVWQQEQKPSQTECTHDNSSIPTLPTVLYMSNDLICGYILTFTSACRQKKHHITYHVKFATIHQYFMSTILYITLWQFLCCQLFTTYAIGKKLLQL